MSGEPIFAPPVGPSFPVDDVHQPRSLNMKFGDGYIARAYDGINTDLEMPVLNWDNLSPTEFAPIWNFFRNLGGQRAFLYSMPWNYDLGWKTLTLSVNTDNTTALNIAFYLEETTSTSIVAQGDSGVRGLGLSTPQLFNLTDGGAELLQQAPDNFSAWSANRAAIQHDYLIDSFDNRRGDRMIDDGSAAQGHYLAWTGYTKAALVKNYQLSMNVKPDGYPAIFLEMFAAGGQAASMNVNLNTLAVTPGTAGSFTIVSATATNAAAPPPKKYICQKFERHRMQAGSWNLKAELMQVTEG